MSARPEVSVVTPAFRASATIERAIASVRAQSFEDWEMIVVDDASDDDTGARVRALAEAEPRLEAIALSRNGGAARARNLAMARARGRFVAFLDADDAWYPEKLALQVAFARDRSAALCHTGYDVVNEAGAALRTILPPPRVDRAELLKSNVIGCSTAMFDVERVGNVEMPEIAKPEDFGFWLRLLAGSGPALGIEQPLARYTVRKHSSSSDKIDAAFHLWRYYRSVERMPMARASYYFSINCARWAIRRLSPRPVAPSPLTALTGRAANPERGWKALLGPDSRGG